MKALVVSIWVFINLVFFGMCGYMYLLWSQYWMFMERQSISTTSTYDQQIYYYNRGYLPETNKTHNYTEIKIRTKHSPKENNITYTLVKNSRPRFPNVQAPELELDSKRFICQKNDTDCSRKTSDYKNKILSELKRVLEEEGNVLKTGAENLYNVEYKGAKGSYDYNQQNELMCQMKRIRIKTLRKGDVRNDFYRLNEVLPRKNLFENRKFNSCAIVASAGALRGSNLGPFIDSHDLVLRFNHAPVKGFEEDVGRKTTMRLLNSQVVTRKEFRFLDSDMFKNVTVVAWDPSNYKASIDEWLEKPEFNLFPTYVRYRKINQKSRFFLLDPFGLWELWDFLQSNSPCRLRRNPPSSGFLGVSVLLPSCNFVDVFEYVPSARVTKRCHYYDPEDNPACTFGVWHPLAAEKLLAFHLNIADDRTVFQKGFIRIKGFRHFKCDGGE